MLYYEDLPNLSTHQAGPCTGVKVVGLQQPFLTKAPWNPRVFAMLLGKTSSRTSMFFFSYLTTIKRRTFFSVTTIVRDIFPTGQVAIKARVIFPIAPLQVN